MPGVYAGKPIIGIAGGIGSGKSTIAHLLGEMGCLVLSADDHVREVYRDAAITAQLREWWGSGVFDDAGEINRRLIAQRIFNDPAERARLESLIHPAVSAIRLRAMSHAAHNEAVKAFVWDIPLLFEVGLDRQCDVTVFVDAPLAQRQERVQRTRGWDEKELIKRENSQLPLDIKRKMANYIIQNTADVGFARKQLQDLLADVLSKGAMDAPGQSSRR